MRYYCIPWTLSSAVRQGKLRSGSVIVGAGGSDDMRTSGDHEVVEEADVCAQKEYVNNKKIIDDFKMLGELTGTVVHQLSILACDRS